MNENFYHRQTGIIDPKNLDFPILIVGVGTVGSWTALALSKIGCEKLFLCDPDVVEEANIGPQIYREDQIGKPKVEAMTHFIKDPGIRQGRVEDIKALNASPVIINAADSMDTRKYLFENLSEDQLLIDGRMAGNAIEIYTATSNGNGSMKHFEKTLFDSSKARPIPCGMKAVAYNGFVMGGLIADLVSKYANKEELPKELLVDLKNLTLFK